MERVIDSGADRIGREQIRQKSYASRYAFSIIRSLKEVIPLFNNRMTQIRLSRKFYEIIQASILSSPDWKADISRNLSETEGFEFNANSTFSSIFFGFYKTSISRSQGKVCIKLNSFVPSLQIASPGGATHFEIISLVCESKDHAKNFKTTLVKSKVYELSDNSIGDIFFIHKISAKSFYPLFIILGVNFYELIDGKPEKLMAGELNCLMIITADNNKSNKRNRFEKRI